MTLAQSEAGGEGGTYADEEEELLHTANPADGIARVPLQLVGLVVRLEDAKRVVQSKLDEHCAKGTGIVSHPLNPPSCCASASVGLVIELSVSDSDE